ncbi:hypothetical protein MTX80_17850 [Gordonia amicalis]|nr:hypothetical protein [Gordonia amicalis]UOG20899.1 hypothetical protein MTX80_17850 [Gordonia amicalis]
MRLHNRVTAFVDGDEYGLARVVVAVRMAVVASVGVLVLVGPAWVRQHVPAAVGILIAATVYAMVLLANPKFEARRTRYSWAVALADSAITLAWIAVTGGPHSPVVAVLPLVVIASAARLSFIETLLLSTLLGLAYTAVIVPSSSTPATALSPWAQASWWALYLLFAAVLTAGLSTLAEREHRSRLRALVEAETQHAAAEEERDLRSRLLTSYQSQQDGLQVLVHEFRTPHRLAGGTARCTGRHLTDDGRRPQHQPAAGQPAHPPCRRHARRTLRRRAEPTPHLFWGAGYAKSTSRISSPQQPMR